MIALLCVTFLFIKVVVYLATKLISYIYRIRLLNQIPGLEGFPLFGPFFHLLWLSEKERLIYLTDNFKKNGNILKVFAFPIHVVAIADADVAEALLSTHANVKKVFAYQVLEPWLGKSILTLQDSSKNSEWRVRRRAAAPCFNSTVLNTFFDIFAEQSEKLLKALEEKLDDPKGFDICPYITDFAMNTVCETIIGLDSNGESSSSFSKYTKAINNMMEIVIYKLLRPWMWLELTSFFTKTYRKQRKSLHTIHSITMNIIRKKKKNRKVTNYDNPDLQETTLVGKGKKIFLDFLLDTTEKCEQTFSDIDVRSELNTFIFAGYETTSTSLSFTLYLLGLHQDIQDKVVAELDQVLGSLPPDRTPTVNQISQLKYLECVIKESLRLFPSVAAIGKTTLEDIKINNYQIPANTFVHVSIFHIHRNPLYYSDPESFNPDNFSEERIKTRHPFAFIPFSAGPRNCIGQKYAMLEMKEVLAMFLRKYKIVSLDTLRDLSVSQKMVLCATDGIHVRISRRM